MLAQLTHAGRSYPRQFWLMFWGMLISATGASMIWPFLMIYVSEHLRLPLVSVASLMTLSSVMGLLASVVAGPVIDRAGRKWVMAVSLGLNAAGYFFLSRAHTLPEFAVLMALNGAVNPLYRVGADAMMADLLPPDRRIDAYSLMRLANNVGVALGPSLGGFIATISYAIAFYCAAAGLLVYGLLMALFAAETLPARQPDSPPPAAERLGGYGQIWRDRPFVTFTANFALVQVCAAVMWVLLAVYAKEHFNVPESQFGWIPTTNASIVLLFQFGVTQISKRYRPQRVMALGAALYAVATLSIAFGQGFWAFWASMAVMTVGELLLVPTSSTYAANLAPADKRGRYMGLYGLTWGAATAVGPVFGGLLNDTLEPRAIWYGAAAAGFVSVAGFLRLREPRPPASG
jgi:MFS family permease